MLLLLALFGGMLAAGLPAKSSGVKSVVAKLGYGCLLLLLMVVGARVTADPQVWASFTEQWWKGLAVGIGATGASLYAGRLVLDTSGEEDG